MTQGRSGDSIVLIGMPGCGKTSVGQAVAALASMPFWDTDAMIAALVGMPARDYLRARGEAAFRAVEAQAVADAASRRGVVIATGGGSVLRAENREALRQGSYVIHLRRPLQKLSIEGRPLSVNLPALAAVRMPIYRACACDAVDNFTTIEAVARQVLWRYGARE